MEYLIRRVAFADLSRLVQLCAKHADYEGADYDSTGKQERLAAELFSESRRLHCHVIERAGSIEGYFTFTLDFSTWDARPFLHLDCLYLEPNLRGQGIGKQIFQQLEQIARELECFNIQWQTPITNEPAIRFYDRLGATGRDKKRYGLAL
ncbi:MAG: GNAT family N-acetyltransferase [Dyadobacter sp. 50-39]|uniref:GNAT family N-acetyltransferase n=1 Tax=Dyadobacter sp. 50-39 TaxID=1895756 RepID=UPI0009673F87|nr:GNAT family N-acetyltransferase [Dyadobacter sp. 50-39]OJV14334.1 MAG: GNAT family N-acetyltransferase [Dyadobacter sp. 50-39]